jgi:hypothetical protein
MNQRLSEVRIRATCRELLANQRHVSGRALRRALRTRYGAVGKTARVFRIWREEEAAVATVQTSSDLREMQRRLKAAEELAAQHLARAERAEYRETVHQDSWALEIDRLRAQLRAQSSPAAEVRALQEQVARLTVQLHAANVAALNKGD